MELFGDLLVRSVVEDLGQSGDRAASSHAAQRLLHHVRTRIPNLPDRISSQDDDVAKSLTAYLKKIGYGSPNQADFLGATHAKAKIAFKMGQWDVKNATVVINNNAGVCTGVDSCSRSVKATLPKGSEMTVYHPGSRTKTEIVGEGPERP
ncbi:DddA-like double-stranded DNA deaminase toxin [Streptomyces anulatus]